MNERLTKGKKTKQQAFLSGNQVHLSSAAPWEVTSAEAESDWHIMLRDTLKTLKRRF